MVGIMPASFENEPAPMAQACSQLQYDPLLPSVDSREWGHHLDMLARVRPDLGLDEARRALGAIAEQSVPEFSRPPWASMGQGLSVRRLRDAAYYFLLRCFRMKLIDESSLRNECARVGTSVEARDLKTD